MITQFWALRRWWKRNPWLLDAFLVVLTLALAIALTGDIDNDPPRRDVDIGAWLLIVAMVGQIMARRTLPIVAVCVGGFSLTAYSIIGYGETPASFAVLIAVYSVAVYGNRVESIVALVLTGSCITLVCISLLLFDDNFSFAEYIATFVIYVTAWVLGDRMKNRRLLVVELEERARRNEVEQIEQARRAVLNERARIARELHDVVAHSLSVMVIHAGAARRSLDDRAADEAETLQTIEHTGRETLSEMRKLLSVLRSDGAVDGALTPQPKLDRLRALVEQLRSAGLDVDLHIDGDPISMSPGIDLSAYRIVQEALTNAHKHAGPAHVDVTIDYCDDSVAVEVTDDGRGAAAWERRPGPRSHRNARARAALRRRAADRPEGRWRVHGSRSIPNHGRNSVIEVVLADDQALVRSGFKMILDAEQDIGVVGEAADGVEAIAVAKQTRPNVVVMDVRMPNMDGIEATSQLMATPHPPRVLVVTTFDLDEYVYAALQAGASGFLLKDAPPEQLVHAVRVVYGGDALLSPSVTSRLISDFTARAPAANHPAIADLTEREREVLGCVARGLSNAEIAAELYVGETTVKTHVGRILMKLSLRDRVQAVVLAYESGLVQPGQR